MSLKGALRMRLVMFVYMKSEKTTLRFGRGSNSRHPLNMRKLVAVVKRYAAGVLIGGAASIFRGCIVCMVNTASRDPDAKLLLAGASLTEGIEMAVSTHPSNIFVHDLVTHGLSDVFDMDTESPDDVIAWVVMEVRCILVSACHCPFFH